MSRWPSLMGYLGVAVLGVAVLGTAVLGVAVLGTAVLHRTLPHPARPWLAPHSSIRASQSSSRKSMSQSPQQDGDTLVWPCWASPCSGPPCCTAHSLIQPGPGLRPTHLSEHPKAAVASAINDGPSKMGYLGVAVLGVAVLGTAVLHHTLTHPARP